MSRYKKGADFERRVKKLLRELGFYVVRSAGSRGAFDLIAFKCLVFGVQVKVSEKNLTVDEIDKAIEEAKPYNIIPLFAVRRGRKIVFLDHRRRPVDIEALVEKLKSIETR